MDGFRGNYNLDNKILNRVMKLIGWSLMIIGLLLIFAQNAESDIIEPDVLCCPANENWCFNFSQTMNITNAYCNLTHAEFDGIQEWDISYLLIGDGGNITTDSVYSHNITLTNYSSTYSRLKLSLNGLTNVTLRNMLPNTNYSVVIDGVYSRTITSDADGILEFNESSTGLIELQIQETTGAPSIISQYNNYTADSSTVFTAERLSAIYFEAKADQVISNWTCINSTYVLGNGTDTGRCERYFPSEGTFNISIYGENTNGQTGWANWTVTIKDTTPPSAVTGLGEIDVTTTTITWAWTNPSEADFNHSMIFLDGTWKTNTTGESWQATGLSEGTTYTITVRVCDVYGNCGNDVSDSATTLSSSGGGGGGVTNSPPTADFTYTVDGKTVTFTDASSDDGIITDWFWDFGDGDTSTEQNPVHTYSDYGEYNVRLTVTDDGGLTDDVTKTVILSPPPSEFKLVNYTPSFSPVSSTRNSTMTFTVHFNMIADNVTWYFNGSGVKTEHNVLYSSYTNNTPAAGWWKITMLADNNSENGGYVMQTWYWQVTNGTFPTFTTIQTTFKEGSLNVLGASTLVVAIVFFFLFALCHAGKLSANASVIVIVPTLWGFVESSLNWLDTWVKAVFVIGMTTVIWFMLWRFVER
jgi:PKD repeat protein